MMQDEENEYRSGGVTKEGAAAQCDGGGAVQRGGGDAALQQASVGEGAQRDGSEVVSQWGSDAERWDRRNRWNRGIGDIEEQWNGGHVEQTGITLLMRAKVRRRVQQA
jgi:hypothetical protein